jgi:hypothetical protein
MHQADACLGHPQSRADCFHRHRLEMIKLENQPGAVGKIEQDPIDEFLALDLIVCVRRRVDAVRKPAGTERGILPRAVIIESGSMARAVEDRAADPLGRVCLEMVAQGGLAATRRGLKPQEPVTDQFIQIHPWR